MKKREQALQLRQDLACSSEAGAAVETVRVVCEHIFKSSYGFQDVSSIHPAKVADSEDSPLKVLLSSGNSNTELLS